MYILSPQEGGHLIQLHLSVHLIRALVTFLLALLVLVCSSVTAPPSKGSSVTFEILNAWLAQLLIYMMSVVIIIISISSSDHPYQHQQQQFRHHHDNRKSTKAFATGCEADHQGVFLLWHCRGKTTGEDIEGGE